MCYYEYLLSIFVILNVTTQCRGYSDKYYEVNRFPDGFLFGAASSAYQIEGAWNVDGKGENIIDRLVHTKPCYAEDCSNGDVAANSYFLYERDVEMIRELGLDFYRFSMSWTRILPKGFPNKINYAGIQYYNNLINELLKYNIKPVVTLFHWDLPQALQDLGGLANPNFMNWFGDYAKVVFEHFGDRVKYWITINEPQHICTNGYDLDNLPPAIKSEGIGVYECSKNILLGHARVYHIYDELYRSLYKGVVFLAINSVWYEPASESELDLEAANDMLNFLFCHYVHPIFSKNGDFPEVVKRRVAAKSLEQGFFRSRLPELTKEEVNYLRGTADMLGLNHYITNLAYKNKSAIFSTDGPSWRNDHEVITFQLDEWKIGDSNRTRLVPWGFYKMLNRIKADFGNPPIFVTENGFSSHGGLYDDDRVIYYKSYLHAMLDAIDDGVNVVAYSAWSLMDNFEWIQGFTERFGLYEVDFNSTLRIRTPRKSAYVYKEIVRTRYLDLSFEPDLAQPMMIDQGH